MTGSSLYSPERHELVKTQIQLEEQHYPENLFYGRISLHLTFYSRIPKKSKKSVADFLTSSQYHRYDLLPFIRYIQAALPEIIHEPNTQIVALYAKKLYDPQARTEITIFQLEETNEEENP